MDIQSQEPYFGRLPKCKMVLVVHINAVNVCLKLETYSAEDAELYRAAAEPRNIWATPAQGYQVSSAVPAIRFRSFCPAWKPTGSPGSKRGR
jgi:hypothetical protein